MKPQARLVLFGVVAIAGGLVVPFLPPEAGRDVLAGVVVLGGFAMVLVALASWGEDWRQ